jgi:hypothetical protein
VFAGQGGVAVGIDASGYKSLLAALGDDAWRQRAVRRIPPT